MVHRPSRPLAADTFEEALVHALDLLADNPKLGEASARSENDRRLYLPDVFFHVYYRLHPEREEILVVRLRHAKRRPLKDWQR